MKIAQILTSTGWGGAEKMFTLLSNELSKDHDVTVICYHNDSISSQLSKSINYITIPVTSRNSPRTYWSLYKILKYSPFDIVHTHGAKSSEIIHRLSRFLKLTQVATKHNARKGSIFNKLKYVTAVSKVAAQSISGNAEIIYNGISAQQSTLDDFKNHPFKILAVGRLDPLKGFDNLIRQTAKLNIDFRLDILGDGPQRKELTELACTLGISDKIIFQGYQETIKSFMNEADLVIISSLTEGFSLVAIEALFHAKVLISTEVGIAGEILDHSLLTDHNTIAEKIQEIVDNYSEYRQRFKTIQNKKASTFTIETVAKNYEEYFQKVLNQP